MTILFEGSAVGKADVPSARTGCALATDDNHVYIFGGKDDSSRLNDIWSFSLADLKFQKLNGEGMIPAVRNGHTMNYYQEKLYMFGGIHDITWELDDLHIYDLKANKWTTLEQDSPRKIEKKNNNEPNVPEERDLERKGSKKKNWYETHSAGLKKDSPNSPSKNFSITYNEDANNNNNRSESPGKMLDEQRRKVFYQKKA